MTNHLAEISPRRLAVRSKLDLLQEIMEAGIAGGELEQTHSDATTDAGHEEAEHLVFGGLYARTLTIPAGSVVVGRIHAQDRVCIVSKGRCAFADEHGQRIVSAPFIGKFPKGSKTAVFAFEETVWTAVIATDMTDPKEIVSALSSGNFEDYKIISERSAGSQVPAHA